MTDRSSKERFIILVAVVIGAILMVVAQDIGRSQGVSAVQSEAVSNGYASYNQQTGSWQWNPTPTVTPEGGQKLWANFLP